MPENAKAYHELKIFRETLNDLEGIYNQFSKQANLSDAEFWSLILICEGTTTQKEISNQLALSRQTVNSAFKLLVKKGWVTLEPLEHDLRTKQATLTTAGKKFADQCVQHVHQVEEHAWLGLAKSEREQLIKLTRKYKELMETAFLQ